MSCHVSVSSDLYQPHPLCQSPPATPSNDLSSHTLYVGLHWPHPLVISASHTLYVSLHRPHPLLISTSHTLYVSLHRPHPLVIYTSHTLYDSHGVAAFLSSLRVIGINFISKKIEFKKSSALTV